MFFLCVFKCKESMMLLHALKKKKEAQLFWADFNSSCLSVWFPVIRLDYSGIALLIMGSFVPWLYYSFYCSPQPRLIYLTIVCVLGIAAIVVAQWDRFSTPRHRPTRAGTQRFCRLSVVCEH